MVVGLAVWDEEATAKRKDATMAHERQRGSDRGSLEADIRNSFRGRYRQTTQEGGGGQDSRAINNRNIRSLREEVEKLASKGGADRSEWSKAHKLKGKAGAARGVTPCLAFTVLREYTLFSL
jgi:hypothetical protein